MWNIGVNVIWDTGLDYTIILYSCFQDLNMPLLPDNDTWLHLKACVLRFFAATIFFLATNFLNQFWQVMHY